MGIPARSVFKGSQIFGEKNKGSQILRRKFKGFQINFKVCQFFFKISILSEDTDLQIAEIGKGMKISMAGLICGVLGMQDMFFDWGRTIFKSILSLYIHEYFSPKSFGLYFFTKPQLR